MAPPFPHEVFVGRAAELVQLCSQVEAVRAGQSRLVVVEGDAGQGKSALLRRLLLGAAEMGVITASGDEAEASLPYGMIAQLVGSARVLEGGPHGSLQGFALLRPEPPPDADPLAVGAQLLGLLGELQDSGPVAMVIEDLQWIDHLSAKALLFALRRLLADRVLVLISARPMVLRRLGEGWSRLLTSDPRSTWLRLPGLSAEELVELAPALGRGRLSLRGARRLVEHTGGNALFSRALLEELPPGALETAPNEPLPAPESLAAIILPRMLALSLEARTLVFGAAILGLRTTLDVASAVAGISDPAAALEEAIDARFLSVERDRDDPGIDVIAFTHHLVRRAIYDDLGLARRRALHLRASRVVEPAAVLSHRVAASAGPDPALAADLQDAADNALSNKAFTRAGGLYLQAARLVEPGVLREHLLLAGMESYLRVGEKALAETVRPMVEALAPTARRDATLGHLALLSARSTDAEALLLNAWETHEYHAEFSAGADAALLLGTLYVLGRSREALTWTSRALATTTQDEQWNAIALYTHGMALALVEGPRAALECFADMGDEPSLVPPAQTDVLTGRGMVKLWCEDLVGAVADLSVAASRSREGQQVHYPGQPLAFLAEAEFALGNWDEAATHAELAVSLAYDADRRWDYPFTHAIASAVPALRGNWDQADAHVRAAEETAAAFGARIAVIFAGEARCILGFAQGDPIAVLRGATAALGNRAGGGSGAGGSPAVLGRGWRPLQIWALIKLGQLDEAEAVLADFSAVADAHHIPSGPLRVRHLNGLLAGARGDAQTADREFAAARTASPSLHLPFYRALVDLDWGRSLRQRGKGRPAIEALSSARQRLEALGARPFMDTCDTELAALGRPTPASPHSKARLTHQEEAVARLVARGMSNREAAAELYVSPKTIEFHLGNVYVKLGVRSRSQLAHLLKPSLDAVT